MGWDSLFFLQVHGPLSEVLHFRHENVWPFYTSPYYSWVSGDSYERISPPANPFFLSWWECTKSEKELETFVEEEERKVFETEEEKQENKKNEETQKENDLPSLSFLVAKTCARHIDELQKDILKILPKECLFQIFCHFCSDDLIRLRFEDESLNKRLKQFMRKSTMTLFYLYEARKGCYRLEDYQDSSRKFPNLCMHFAVWDQCNCDHIDYHCCMTKGDRLYERTLYNYSYDVKFINETMKKGNHTFHHEVSEKDYFRDVEDDVILLIGGESLLKEVAGMRGEKITINDIIVVQ